MIAYEFYWRDEIGRDFFIGRLPERRKARVRVTEESILNLGRKMTGNRFGKDIHFYLINIDEAQVESWGLPPSPELEQGVRGE